MAHYGILRGESVSEVGEDIRGSHLYGVGDEKLGKIDDVIFDHASGDIRYVVVDTGGWLKSHKFIVPTTELRTSAKLENDYEANLATGNLDSERAAAAQGHGVAPGVRRNPIPMRGNEDISSTTSDRVVPAGSDAVVIDNSAVGIGGRWDTFQSRLRERRKQAVASCDTCTGDSSQHSSEDAGSLRKAV